MSVFEEMLNDVGAHVAATFSARPPAIHAAVDSVARALLGDRLAASRIRRLAVRLPHTQPLLGAVHRRLMDHPQFRHALCATQLHRRPLPPSHPKAAIIRQGVRETLHDVDDALPGFLLAVNHVKRQDAIRHAAGRLHGPAHGGAHHVYAHPSHRARPGSPWRPEPPSPPRAYWEGPIGWGAEDIQDEREELEDAASPDDREPEWEGDGRWGAGD
jgi:hypothetical protein